MIALFFYMIFFPRFLALVLATSSAFSLLVFTDVRAASSTVAASPTFSATVTVSSAASVNSTVDVPSSSLQATPLVLSGPLTTDFMVQVDDLARAGFTDVRRAMPRGGRFEEPVRYFRVGERLSAQESLKDCDDCGDLAMVYVTRAIPTSTPVWVVRANPLVQTVGGRLQLRWFAANRVITVIAPGGEERVRALGSWLRERAILGKNN